MNAASAGTGTGRQRNGKKSSRSTCPGRAEKDRRLIHPATEHTDVTFAPRQQLRQGEPVERDAREGELRERERNHEGGRGRHARSDRDRPVHPEGEATGRERHAGIEQGLGGRLRVVAPVARWERCDPPGGGVAPRRIARVAARDRDQAVGRRAPCDDDVALDGEREDGKTVVVGVLAKQVCAPGCARHDRRSAAAEAGQERGRAIAGIRRHDTRRDRKKSCRSVRARSASTPACTTIRWLRRRSAARSYSDPAAPAFGSAQP